MSRKSPRKMGWRFFYYNGIVFEATHRYEILVCCGSIVAAAYINEKESPVGRVGFRLDKIGCSVFVTRVVMQPRVFNFNLI